MWKQCKHWCITLHRYLGFVLSLLFVIWFLSGFVMMYVDFPTWGKPEQLEHLASVEDVRISVAEAADIAGFEESLSNVQLEMMLDRPVYRFQSAGGNYAHIYADNGTLVSPVSESTAQDIARHVYSGDAEFSVSEFHEHQDQWIPQQGNKRHLPYYRFKLDDDARTWIYVSRESGEQFQKVTGSQRFWAWLGPIPHWIYFTDLRVNTSAWRQVIILSSGVGAMMCLFGIIAGTVRFRRKRNQQTFPDKLAFSPYTRIWFRWHHYFGFIFGLIIFTWTVSGLFSINPWRLNPPPALNETEREIWKGGDLKPENLDHDISAILEKFGSDVSDISRTEIHKFAGDPYYRLYAGNGSYLSVGINDQQESLQFYTVEEWDEEVLTDQILKTAGDKPLKDIVTLEEYDKYYYSRDGSRHLPVIRARFADEAGTWYYADPTRAEITLKNNSTNRFYRWLYNGLHSLDFAFLINRRPLWDIVVILLLIGGTVASISGLVLAWKWIRNNKVL